MAKQDDYVRYTIRVPASLYQRVQAAAGDRSVNAEIIARLECSFDASSDPQSAASLQARIDALEARYDAIESLMGQFANTIRKQPPPSRSPNPPSASSPGPALPEPEAEDLSSKVMQGGFAKKMRDIKI